jgi:hypothetical protein
MTSDTAAESDDDSLMIATAWRRSGFPRRGRALVARVLAFATRAWRSAPTPRT